MGRAGYPLAPARQRLCLHTAALSGAHRVAELMQGIVIILMGSLAS